MAKISLNLDERSLRNGMAQVRIRISHRGTNSFIGTGVYVEPQYFLPGSLYDPLHRRTPHGLEKREQICTLVQQLDEWLLNMSKAELKDMTANDIRERAGMCALTRARSSEVHHCSPRREGGSDFLRWFSSYGESRLTNKTRKSYEYAWHVLCEYCSSLGLQTLTFLDIDYARLADFSRWLTASGRGESTRHMLESYVRAAYKEAQKRHLVSRDNDPYFDYSIRPIPRKDIDSLTVDQMRRLQVAELPSGLSKARDIAMISFYLCGANLLDMYEMGGLQDGEAVFVRHKTQRNSMRPVHIRVEPELQALLDVYGGKGALLGFKAAYRTYDTFQRRVTRLLSDVSAKVGFDVTLAKVRRTWATIAAGLEVSEWVIDKSMGHVDNTINRRHYSDYEWSLTAKANRRVIDAVLGV